jgi:hypothetical protein
MSRYSLLDGETHEYGDLVLTIEFDVSRGSWIIGVTSPPLWVMGHNWTHGERVYSQVLMPAAAYENDETHEYLAGLLAIHFERLGLLYTVIARHRPRKRNATAGPRPRCGRSH